MKTKDIFEGIIQSTGQVSIHISLFIASLLIQEQDTCETANLTINLDFPIEVIGWTHLGLALLILLSKLLAYKNYPNWH